VSVAVWQCVSVSVAVCQCRCQCVSVGVSVSVSVTVTVSVSVSVSAGGKAVEGFDRGQGTGVSDSVSVPVSVSVSPCQCPRVSVSVPVSVSVSPCQYQCQYQSQCQCRCRCRCQCRCVGMKNSSGLATAQCTETRRPGCAVSSSLLQLPQYCSDRAHFFASSQQPTAKKQTATFCHSQLLATPPRGPGNTPPRNPRQHARQPVAPVPDALAKQRPGLAQRTEARSHLHTAPRKHSFRARRADQSTQRNTPDRWVPVLARGNSY
jgi:hypothetical protein